MSAPTAPPPNGRCSASRRHSRSCRKRQRRRKRRRPGQQTDLRLSPNPPPNLRPNLRIDLLVNQVGDAFEPGAPAGPGERVAEGSVDPPDDAEPALARGVTEGGAGTVGIADRKRGV